MTSTAPAAVARPMSWRAPAVIILCGCLISVLSFGPCSSLGFFLTPLSQANGWGRDVFALALAIQNLLWGLGQPLAGAIADMVIELEAIEPHLETVAADWSNGVDHGAAWPSKVFAAKYHAVEGSWRVVDLGLDVTGGYGIFRSAGYERLVRDARLGRIHPANSFLTHEVVAKTALGISLDEQPRWG